MLILYFDSLRISANNTSITHQVNRSYPVLKPCLIMILSKVSDELVSTISEEELKFFKIAPYVRIVAGYFFGDENHLFR